MESSLLEQEPLMAGARNAVAFMGIRPEYEVLIGFTANSDARTVRAVASVIREIGAKLSLIEVPVPGLNQRWPRALEEAIKGVDYYIGMGAGPGVHTLATYIPMFDYGVSMGVIAAEPGFLESEVALWPGRLWVEIHNRLKWQISGDEIDPGRNVEFRISDDRGTNLSYRVKCPENLGAGVGATPLEAGYWGDGVRPRILVRAGFPPSHIPMGDLQHSAEGVLYADTSNYFGRTPEPLKLTFSGGYCTSIEGGEWATRVWESTIGAYRNANRLREVAITLHPKMVSRAPVWDPDAPVPLTMFASAGVGDVVTALGGDTGVGGVDPGYEHITTFFTTSENSTVTADDQLIVDRGRLLVLDDPAVQEFARQFGDPAELLSPARRTD